MDNIIMKGDVEMKVKEKVKNFWDKHGPGIEAAVVTLGVGASGVFFGYQLAQSNFAAGLNMCLLVDPELKPRLQAALEKGNKIIK